jgi:hypothetical protein
MKNFTKNYVGKGKKTEFTVKVTLKMEDILKFKYERDGVEYFTFDLAEMKEADSFGRTHTAYVTTASNVPDQEKANEPQSEAPKKVKRSRKAAATK